METTVLEHWSRRVDDRSVPADDMASTSGPKLDSVSLLVGATIEARAVATETFAAWAAALNAAARMILAGVIVLLMLGITVANTLFENLEESKGEHQANPRHVPRRFPGTEHGTGEDR